VGVELYAFDCGQLTMPTGTFLENEEGSMTVPVPAFLIKHPKGSVLFDSGLHDQLRTDPLSYFGEELNALVEVHYHQNETVEACLSRIDVDVSDISHLVNSHLHFDHCGGNCKITSAPVIVQKKEWEWATKSEPDLGYYPSDYQTGQDNQQDNGEHDIFGDASVVCLPTYGHTPGHQSLRVRTENTEFVLTGDACYLRQTLENLHLPGVLYNREDARASLRTLRELQSRGAKIIYGHDPEFWPSVIKAPERMA